MPGKTGLDLLAELKEKGSDVPVVMISAFADAGTEAMAIQRARRAFLKKPFRRQELLDCAFNALECP